MSIQSRIAATPNWWPWPLWPNPSLSYHPPLPFPPKETITPSHTNPIVKDTHSKRCSLYHRAESMWYSQKWSQFFHLKGLSFYFIQHSMEVVQISLGRPLCIRTDSPTFASPPFWLYPKYMLHTKIASPSKYFKHAAARIKYDGEFV